MVAANDSASAGRVTAHQSVEPECSIGDKRSSLASRSNVEDGPPRITDGGAARKASLSGSSPGARASHSSRTRRRPMRFGSAACQHSKSASSFWRGPAGHEVATTRRSRDSGTHPDECKSTAAQAIAASRACTGWTRHDWLRFKVLVPSRTGAFGADITCTSRAAGEGGLELDLLAIANHDDLELIARLVLSHAFHVVVDRADLLGTTANDAIAVLEAGLGRRSAVANACDPQAIFLLVGVVGHDPE